MLRFFRPRGKELYVSSIRYSQLKNFSKGELFFKEGTFFHKMNFFSQTARCSPHEPWELVPLGELSLPEILQLWNRRFPVSGMRCRGNPCGHPVIANKAPYEPWELVPLGELSLSGILQLRNRRFLVSGMRRRDNLCGLPCGKKDCFTPLGFAMT